MYSTLQLTVTGVCSNSPGHGDFSEKQWCRAHPEQTEARLTAKNERHAKGSVRTVIIPTVSNSEQGHAGKTSTLSHLSIQQKPSPNLQHRLLYLSGHHVSGESFSTFVIKELHQTPQHQIPLHPALTEVTDGSL